MRSSEIATLFLKLGATGFGGPMALIALMERECCHRLKWLTDEAFKELFLFCKLLPGPVAFQMSVAIGQQLKGRRGGLLAGFCFVLPAAVLILALSFVYESIYQSTFLASAMDGMRVGAIAVIVDSVLRMAKPYRTKPSAYVLAFAAAILMLRFPRWEPLLILAGGLGAVYFPRRFNFRIRLEATTLALLFWTHFKAGAFVFGTGLAIVPFLENDVVKKFGWLTTQQFLDGIALGQVTPGPITITSVFIGYKTAAFAGALASLVGMYLPGVLLVLFIVPMLRKRLQGTQFLELFQQGAIPVVIGCILGASLWLSRFAIHSVDGVVVLLCAGLLILFSKAPGWFVILGAGIGTAVMNGG